MVVLVEGGGWEPGIWPRGCSVEVAGPAAGEERDWGRTGSTGLQQWGTETHRRRGLGGEPLSQGQLPRSVKEETGDVSRIRFNREQGDTEGPH